MRVLNVIGSLSPEYGGPVEALANLHEAMSPIAEWRVIGPVGPDGVHESLRPHVGGTVAAVPLSGGPAGRFGFSSELRARLATEIRASDCIIVHGVFDFPSLAAIRLCADAGRPWILRPYGCLDPYDLAKHRLAKAAYLRWIAGELNTVRRVWTTARLEATRLQPSHIRDRARVVPLPVQQLTKPDAGRALNKELNIPADSPIALFLSRVHPKKNLPSVFIALKHPRLSHLHLVIAGSGDPDYCAHLRSLATRLGVHERVHWFGWAPRADVPHLLHRADLFILNSANENFGVAAAEAVAAGIPTIMSRNVFIAHDLEEHGAAIGTDGSPADLAKQMVNLLEDQSLRSQMSTRGIAYWENNWSSQAVAQSLSKLLKAATATSERVPI